MLLFHECEYVILEAGLGGEYDATAVFDKTLTLVTPIDYDHEAFLGSNIEDIAKTKLNAIQNNAIIAIQKYQEIDTIVDELAVSKKIVIQKVDKFLDDKDIEKIELISKKLSLASYLEENLKLSVSALKFLGLKYNVGDFENSKLFGRLSSLNENIIVDVGHNPLAASSVIKALKDEKYILIYNSYKDKEYKKILEILKPLVLHVEIINISDDRIEIKEELQKVLTDLKIEYEPFTKIIEDEKYLVFGSFRVVEEFLKVFNG